MRRASHQRGEGARHARRWPGGQRAIATGHDSNRRRMSKGLQEGARPPSRGDPVRAKAGCLSRATCWRWWDGRWWGEQPSVPTACPYRQSWRAFWASSRLSTPSLDSSHATTCRPPCTTSAALSRVGGCACVLCVRGCGCQVLRN